MKLKVTPMERFILNQDEQVHLTVYSLRKDLTGFISADFML